MLSWLPGCWSLAFLPNLAKANEALPSSQGTAFAPFVAASASISDAKTLGLMAQQ